MDTMSHISRTRDQRELGRIFKGAQAGHGEDLETLFLGSPDIGTFNLQPEIYYYELDSPVGPIVEDNSWQQIDSFEVTLGGGTYRTEHFACFSSSSTNRDVELRFTVNGMPVSDTYSKEAKDTDDTLAFYEFNLSFIPAGTYNIGLEFRVVNGPGNPVVMVCDHRIMVEKKEVPQVVAP